MHPNAKKKDSPVRHTLARKSPIAEPSEPSVVQVNIDNRAMVANGRT